MKIEKKYIEDKHQLKLTVETEQDPFDKAKYLAMKELSKKVKIAGFRPGKAPYKLVAQHVGEDRIINNALESFIDEIYPKIIEEIEETPYGPGQVEEIQSLEPPIIDFIIPLEPIVELGDYRSIRIPFEHSETAEEDVYASLEELQEQHASLQEIEEPAEEKYIVDTKVSGVVVDADPEDEEAQIMNNQPLPVRIKSEEDDDKREWPFPGFSRQLLGVSAGETLELVHEYPDEKDIAEDMRDKEILYTVNVESVKSSSLPALTDAFVQENTNFETKEELLASKRQELEKATQSREKNEHIEKIFDVIMESSTIKFPVNMVENEADAKIEQISKNLEAQGLSLEMLLNMRNTEEEDFREELEEEARQQITRSLALQEIIENEPFDISQKDIMENYYDILDQSFGEDSEARENFEGSVDALNLLNSLSSDAITSHALDFLQALATGEDVSRFMKAEEEDEGEDDDGEVEIETEAIEETQDVREENNADEAAPTPGDVEDTPEDDEESEDQE